jgi:hypothetical protein
LTLAKHEEHLEWHRKFRVYFGLRRTKFPELADMCKPSWTPGQKTQIVGELVALWKQVDGSAPWFDFAELQKKKDAQAAQAAAKRAAALTLR